MTLRSLVLTVMFVCCAGLLEVRARTVAAPNRHPLVGLPMTIGGWQGRATAPLDARVLAVLGADDYTNRIYTGPSGRQAGLYIGYHATQRQGDSIHSPMNCLPGAGWQPVRRERIALDGDEWRTVNKIIIQNGEDRQLVLYWYQSHGRIIASEYTAKAQLFLDALRTGRTDAALVRIITPIRPGSNDSEQGALDAAAGFATDLVPLLSRHVPN